MPLRALIAAVMFSVLSTSAVADTYGYAEAVDEFYQVDLTTGNAQFIGSTGTFGGLPIWAQSLAYAPDGTLYGVADNIKSLVRLDPASGSATVIGSLGLAGQGVGQNDSLGLGLTVTCDGQLWLSSAATQKIWHVNPATGAATFVGSSGYKISGLGSFDGHLYGIGVDGNEGLYSIDQSTGAASLIGSFKSTIPYIASAGLAFDSLGQLWTALDYIPPPPGSTSTAEWSDLAKIDPTTGHIAITGNLIGPTQLQHVGIEALAITAPVCINGSAAIKPAPALSPESLAALALLMTILAGTTLRRRRPNR